MQPTEITQSGRAYLETVTALLQRCRLADPTAGVWEAADLQWWWRKPRSTDSLAHPFWIDSDGQPIAGVIRTDWVGSTGLDVVLHPSCSRDTIDAVWRRAFELAEHHGDVEMMLDSSDTEAHVLLLAAGFRETDDRGGSAWLAAGDAPQIAPLAAGYVMLDRSYGRELHHMADVNGSDVERRLSETSLYRSDLDLCVADPEGRVVGYGLFWCDPVTSVGFVEPMGTDPDHRRRGIARHILTAGISRLVASGATRIKINYEMGSPGARLYREVGFVQSMVTAMFVRSAP